MAAVSVTHRKEGELKAYYMRKVEEGKNKMSVINALRAKIVARMFAVIYKYSISSLSFYYLFYNIHYNYNYTTFILFLQLLTKFNKILIFSIFPYFHLHLS